MDKKTHRTRTRYDNAALVGVYLEEERAVPGGDGRACEEDGSLGHHAALPTARLAGMEYELLKYVSSGACRIIIRSRYTRLCSVWFITDVAHDRCTQSCNTRLLRRIPPTLTRCSTQQRNIAALFLSF